MNDDPTTPREPGETTSSEPPESTPAPPPFEPDPELIGYLERDQKGPVERR